MLVSIMILLVLLGLSDFLGMRVTRWVLSNMSGYLFLALIIVFQPEIRRALAFIGESKFFEGSRLTYAGCILPLTKREDIAQQYGTRHRAAIGITEETDAVAIVVSEERGEISVTEGGNIIPNLDANALRETLSKLIKIKKSTED